MTIKTIPFLILSFVFINCFAQRNSTVVLDSLTEKEIIVDTLIKNKEIIQVIYITGNAVFMNGYCGGAWPSEEILKSHEKEYPLTNTTILLKNKTGKGKPIKITTDSKGNFKTKLQPGIYNYYMTASYDKKMGSKFNETCELWLTYNFGEIEITKRKTSGNKIILEFGCNPCEPARP
jgi:hypothetical protein